MTIVQEGAVLDPVEFIPERVELDLHSLGLEVRAEGVDWGESSIEAQMVREAEGEQSSIGHRPGVPISIPLRVFEDGATPLADASQRLQSKMGEWQEAGGWVRRDFATDGGFAGSIGYRILRHTAAFRGLGGWLFAHRQDAPEVVLTATRHPLGYATVEVPSEEFSESEARELVFELAGVLGTAPGLIRIRVTNQGAEDWNALILAGEWCDHPQDETAETTAALAYDCVDLTPVGATKKAEREGEEVLRNPSLNAGWMVLFDSEIAGLGRMTHVGVRRPLLRIFDPGEEAGDVQLQARWRSLGAQNWSEGNPIVPTPIVDDWQIVDLGECRPERPVLGDPGWELQVLGRAKSGAGAIDMHRLWPAPTEFWMRLVAPEVKQIPEAAEKKSAGKGESAGGGGGNWSNVEDVKASDDARATATTSLSGLPVGAAARTERFHALAFGNALAEGATVTGIMVEIELSAELTGGGSLRDYEVRIVVGGKAVGENRAISDPWPSADTVRVYGAVDDTWGIPMLSGPDANASNFGVRITAQGGGTGQVARIDDVRMIVYSTEATDESPVCFAGRSIELGTEGVHRQHRTDELWGHIVPEGFYPSSMPAGLGNRKSRFILIPTRGDFASRADSGANPISGTPSSRAAYHFAREAS
jgi:hypothetical protein